MYRTEENPLTKAPRLIGHDDTRVLGRLFDRNWCDLEYRADELGGPAWMPLHEAGPEGQLCLFPGMQRKRIVSAEETVEKQLGCGAFGCVYRTGISGVVFKITGDEDEAAFANWYVDNLMAADQPTVGGVARFDAVYELRGKIKGSRRRKLETFYALWREDAEFLGDDKEGRLKRYINNLGGNGTAKEFEYHYEAMGDEGNTIYWSIQGSANLPKVSQAAAHESWRFAVRSFLDIPAKGGDQTPLYRPMYNYLVQARTLSEIPGGEAIGGSATQLFTNYGIILGDLHLGNIGAVRRDGNLVIVVTDPGYTVFVGDVKPPHAIQGV